MMGVLLFVSLPERMKCIGTILLLRHAPQIYGFAGGLRPYLVSQAFVIVSQLSRAF